MAEAAGNVEENVHYFEPPLMGGWQDESKEQVSEICDQILNGAMMRIGRTFNCGGTLNMGQRVAVLAGEGIVVQPHGTIKGETVALGAPTLTIDGRIEASRELFLKANLLQIGENAVIPRPERWYIHAEHIQFGQPLRNESSWIFNQAMNPAT